MERESKDMSPTKSVLDGIIDYDDYPNDHSFLHDVSDLVAVDDDDISKHFILPSVVRTKKPPTDFADKEALTAVKMAIKFKQENKKEKARRLFEHALALSPKHSDVLLHYGEFLESDQDIISADQYYLKALMLQPESSRALANRERAQPMVKKIDSDVLRRISTKSKNLVKKKKSPTLRQLKEEMYLEHIYHSAAIEGNKISVAETKSILETGLAVPGKSIIEHNEIFGLKSGLLFVVKTLALKEYITTTDILDIHRRVFGHVDPVLAGTFRKSQVFVGQHETPKASDVGSLIEKFLETLQSSHLIKMHPVHIAAYVHHRFVYIHPFTDGNGRTARLLMNLIFIKCGFPLINIRVEDRAQYFECLQIANEGDLRPFCRFIAQATEKTLDAYLSASNCDSSNLIALESKNNVKEVIPLPGL